MPQTDYVKKQETAMQPIVKTLSKVLTEIIGLFFLDKQTVKFDIKFRSENTFINKMGQSQPQC